MSIRVLFVDDEVLWRRTLARALRLSAPCMDASFAESGTEALAILAVQDFDLIVSDYNMPGMTGAEFLAAARIMHPDTPTVILSSTTIDLDPSIADLRLQRSGDIPGMVAVLENLASA